MSQNNNNRNYFLAFVAIALISVLGVAVSGVLNPNTTAPQTTPNPTPTTSPSPTQLPLPTASPAPATATQSTRTPFPTSAPTTAPSPSPSPTPTPDATSIQNVTLSAYEQDENGTVWIISGNLVDTVTNSSVPSETVMMVNAADNSTVYLNCTTDSNGYFQATFQADPQATAVIVVFAGDSQYQPCVSEQVPLTLPD